MTTIDVVFDDDGEEGDERDAIQNESLDGGDDSFDFGSVPSGEGLPPFDPTNPNEEDFTKIINAEIRAAKKAAALEQRRLQQEAQRRFKQEQDDASRAAREALRDSKAASKERMDQLRSNAVAQRIQAYGVASALGMPGYAVASGVDQFIIRPAEEKQVQNEEEYRRQLDETKRANQEDNIRYRRQMEEYMRDVRNFPKAEVNEAAYYEKYGVPPPASSSGIGGAGGSGGGGSGNIPPGMGPPPPPQHPGPPPQPRPLPTPPPMPGQVGNLASVATAAVQAGQWLNDKAKEQAKTSREGILSIAEDTPFDLMKNRMKALKDISDPLGINPISTVSVEGFNTLLDYTKQQVDYVKANSNFGGKAIGATVESDIAKLMQDIAISRRNDPLNAQMIRANAQLERAWSEFKSQIFENIGPTIVTLLRTITTILETITTIISTIRDLGIAIVSTIPGMGMALNAISKWMNSGQQNQQGPDPLMSFDNAMTPKSKVGNP